MVQKKKSVMIAIKNFHIQASIVTSYSVVRVSTWKRLSLRHDDVFSRNSSCSTDSSSFFKISDNDEHPEYDSCRGDLEAGTCAADEHEDQLETSYLSGTCQCVIALIPGLAMYMPCTKVLLDICSV